IGVAFCAASVAAGPAIDRIRRVSSAMMSYGMVIAFAGFFALQFFENAKTGRLVFLGALTLALLLAVLRWAWRTENRPALWLAYITFSIEIFSLYINKLGTLMSTSAFFLVAGLLVVALSGLAYYLHARTQLPSAAPT